MEFAVIDRRTLQCIMTAEEIEEFGMDRRELFKNDDKVREFFSVIMKKTQQETGYYKSKGDVAVQASFLPDESVEITFCVGAENSFQRRQEEPHDKQDKKTQIPMGTVIFKSHNLVHIIDFCHQMAILPQSDLYVYRGIYYLLAELETYEPYDIAVLFNLADEYIEEICYTKSIVACLREHGSCMIPEEAVVALRTL